jgi:hypothetical protein
MRGVYLAAAELARLGFIASPTSRSAIGADILATTHDCNRAFSVQVKTKTSKDNFFLLGTHARSIKSRSHIYVLVHIKMKSDEEIIEYYVVPSAKIAKLSKPMVSWGGKGHVITLSAVQKYRDGWAHFGAPIPSPPTKIRIARSH